MAACNKKRLNEKTTYAVGLGLLLTLAAELAQSQEYRGKNPVRERGAQAMLSGGRIAGMRIFPGIDTLMRDLKLATMRMEMRGEMMKIRAEAMIKRGEMLNRYGEGLENARAE